MSKLVSISESHPAIPILEFSGTPIATLGRVLTHLHDQTVANRAELARKSLYIHNMLYSHDGSDLNHAFIVVCTPVGFSIKPVDRTDDRTFFLMSDDAEEVTD